MGRLIDTNNLPYSEVIINEYGLVNTYKIVVFAEDIENIPTENVVSLDLIKETKEEIEAYCNYATDSKQKIAFNSCLKLINKLISESEDK